MVELAHEGLELLVVQGLGLVLGFSGVDLLELAFGLVEGHFLHLSVEILLWLFFKLVVLFVLFFITLFLLLIVNLYLLLFLFLLLLLFHLLLCLLQDPLQLLLFGQGNMPFSLQLPIQPFNHLNLTQHWHRVVRYVQNKPFLLHVALSFLLLF